MTVEHHFDAQLPARLADLADDGAPVDAALFATIRSRAATQRRRRHTVALAAAALTLLAGLGGTAVLRTAISRPALPAASATASTDLLGWPTRSMLPLPDGILASLTTTWDEQSGTSGHQQVRILVYSGAYAEQPIYVVEGMSPTGRGRLAVFVGRMSAQTGPRFNPGYSLCMDVAIPSPQPQVLLVTVTGLLDSEIGDAGLMIGLLAPSAQPAWVMFPTAELPLTPSSGYAITHIPGQLLTDFDQLVTAFTLADTNRMPQQIFRQVLPDDQDQFAPKYGIPAAAVLAPVDMAHPTPTPTR